MQKLSKKYYYDKNGNQKINCYTVNIAKELLNKTNIKNTDNIEVRADGDKIVIEKKK